MLNMKHESQTINMVALMNTAGALRTLDDLLSSAVVAERVLGEVGDNLFGLSNDEVAESAKKRHSHAAVEDMRSVVMPLCKSEHAATGTGFLGASATRFIPHFSFRDALPSIYAQFSTQVAVPVIGKASDLWDCSQ
jgi:hypothetical protein